MKIRLLVFGGRTYPYESWVHEQILQITGGTPMQDITIIHGDANRERRVGADYWAHSFCDSWRRFGITEETYPAKWDDITAPGAVVRERRDGTKYNVLAGFWRNQEMIDKGKPTHALGTTGGAGTADMRTRIMLANRDGANIVLRTLEDWDLFSDRPTLGDTTL